jgi:broad specificity phosphatase PhoE
VSPARLYLVRHGRPTATFAEAPDAGLDPDGAIQAEAVAGRLGPLGPLAIVSSPLRRARETAAPLERLWGRSALIDAAIAEIPLVGVSLARRGEWLRGVMASRWPDLPAELRSWRALVVEALAGIGQSTVLFTHYVAINVAVGHATGDDHLVVFAPDHCSVTVLEANSGALKLVERGAEAETRTL